MNFTKPRQRSNPVIFFVFLFFACLVLCGISGAAPSISLSKKSGPPTSRILVSGSGFERNVGVDIFFDTKDKALVVTNGKAEFHDARIYAPRSAHPGEHWVTALERNNDKGAHEPFVVFTDWPQVGFDPRKSGLNPYENVLDKNTVRNLNVVWSHKVQDSCILSAVAVADGVAYVSFAYCASYGLYAYNVETGAFLWTYPQAISFPAVKDGVVYVNDSINLDALDARTEKLLWKYAITTTGTTDAPPTVADGRVFIGAGDGNLYALDATSGEFLWRYGTFSQIFGAPAVANGIVYTCSGFHDGYQRYCYAIDERSGGGIWSYFVDGLILGSPVVTNGFVFLDALYSRIRQAAIL